ncbi:MAG: TonB-dependent receptor, partial [Deltaproteobacteria bacterium]|nr:TonB-dependent receptor [Deltaproteobacteria bacterium]
TRTKKKVEEAPVSVTVLTREDLRFKDIQTIDDALEHAVGVDVVRKKGIADSIARVALRGIPGDERTLIMINGLPANDGYSNQVPWNQIPIDMVERIEVTRGPGSALYGGNAMGGVINIVLREPEKLTAQVRGGYAWGNFKNDGGEKTNYGEYRYGLYVSDRLAGKLGLSVGYDATLSDGYPTALVTKSTSTGAGTVSGGYPIQSSSGSNYWVVGDKGDNTADAWSLNVGGSYDTTDTGKIGVNVTRSHHQYDYDPPHSYLEGGVFTGRANAYDGTRTSTIREKDFLSGLGEEDHWITNLSYRERFGDLGFSGKLGYWDKEKFYTSPNTSSSVAGDYNDRPGKITDSETLTWMADLQLDYSFSDDHETVFGLYYRGDDFDQKEYDLTYYRDPDSKTSQTGLTEGKSSLYAVFLQHEWKLSEALSLYGGLRYDFWKTSDGKSGDVSSPTTLADSDDDHLSPKISANWHPLEDTYIRGGISQGFRPPNIYELYRTWTSSTTGRTYNSNPNLKPETVWNYELGVDQYLLDRKVKLGATAFYSEFDDYIESKTIPRPGVPGSSDTIKDNVGSVEIKGLELTGSVYPTDWLKIWANLTLNDAKYKEWPEQPEAENKKVMNVPTELANVGADFFHRWFTLSVAGNYTGRIYTDEENEKIDDTYTTYSKRWLWDAKLVVTPHKMLDVELSVSNIFDEKYFDYYVGQPRTFFVGLKLKY